MAPGPRDAGRLASLDAFRGFAIAGMVLVNNPGDWTHVHTPLRHADWHGWTFTDMVFPFFLFIAGVSMAISVDRRRHEGAGAAELLGQLARRAAVIFLVGLALNLFPAFDLATVRIPGVLQRIALCLLVAAPFVVRGGARTVLAAIAGLFLAYTGVQLLVPVPDPAGVVVAGALEPGRDFGAWLDRRVLGAHLWAKARTWDPEGLVSTLPAAASLLFGVLAGRRLPLGGAAPRRTLGMVLAGLAALAAGLVLDRTLMPINKSLWTVSYAVFMTGWSLLAFAAFHWALDATATEALRRRARAACLPLAQYGMNALFLFALSGFLGRLLAFVRVGPEDATLKTWLYAPFTRLPLAPENASLAWALASCATMYAVAAFLWRKQWFIKA